MPYLKMNELGAISRRYEERLAASLREFRPEIPLPWL
jgi:hypothetical protein